MNYSVLKESVRAIIKENNNEEITGDLLQQVLIAIINTLGAGYQFAGIATPDTQPGTPDARIWYLCVAKGTYQYFGGPFTLDGSAIAICVLNSEWHTEIVDIPTGEYITERLAALATKFENYAKVNGTYPELTSGAAQNLVGRGSVRAEINLRTAGGSADIGSGTATIKKILGKTLALNQHVKKTPVVGTTENTWHAYTESTILSTDGDILTITKNGGDGIAQYDLSQNPIITGHKYFMSAFIKTDAPAGKIRIAAYAVDTDVDAIQATNIGTPNWQKICAIRGCALASGQNVRIINDETEDFHSVQVRDYMFIDLTLMFGAGNEPSTVEEFEAMFPLPHYAYNPGQLVSNKATRLKTVGFNLYNPATGKAYLLGCQTNGYQITGEYTSIAFAKASGGPLELITPDANGQFNVPENGELIVSDGDDSTTCVHLVWSGIRNGEYEPYWESEIELNLATLTGKKDGVGSSVVVFPDGMRSAGSVQSEIEADGVTAHKRIGAVDLGNLDWGYDDTYSGFTAFVSGAKGYFKAVCSKYLFKGAYSIVNDKECGYIYDEYLFVKDSTYGTDAAAFKAAMSGVMLYYELAEPETYILDEPVPMNYRVDDFGTEAKEPADTEQENGVYAPLTLEVQYAMNAVDTLRRLPVNYISKPSFDAFCAELAAKLGAAINKNISIVAAYNAEQEKYNYTITISDIEQP